MTPEQEKLLNDSLTKQFNPTMPPPPIGGSSFDVDSMGPNLDSTVKMNGNLPVAPPPPVSDPVMSAPSQPPAMPEPEEPSDPSAAPAPFGKTPDKVVSSQPGLTPDELQKYLQQQRGQMDKFGPDQEKAVMDKIRADQSGPIHTVARGGAALADGLMQGVARAGNSNYLASIDRRDQNQTENALNEGKELDDSNMKHVAANQSLDQMSPNSPVGKAMMSTYGPLLDKLGIPKDKQAQMIPALVSTMAPELIKHEDAMAKVEAVKAQKEQFAAFRQDNVDQQNWIKLGHDVNALNAGSRKALGVAASANMRADRLLRTAMNPDATNQDIHNMISDVQGIYKGGVPDEISLKHGQYKTLLGDLANMQTLLSSQPTAVRTPEVVQHLAKITRELKEIDNKVISDNLGINHAIYKPLIEKYPDRWQEVVDGVMGATKDPTGSGGSSGPATGPYGASVERNGKTYDWNATTGKYHPR